MRRREFVGQLLFLPVGVFLVHCSSSGDNSSGGQPSGQPVVSGSQVVYTSSTVQAHHHTFGIALMAFTQPPAEGVSGSTSTDSDHAHAVSVSSEQLANVQSGQTVTVTTSEVSGHTHIFTFIKVS